MIPNATLISLITISEEQSEYIIFAYCKQLNEIAPENTYWYKGKGEKGKAEFIWKEKKLKQWLCIGTDEDMSQIWLQLTTNSFKYSNSWDKKSILFEHPVVKEKIKDENYVKIKDIPICGKGEHPIEFELTEHFTQDISFLIGENNNCSFIEGYSHHNKIKPILPYGLLGENTLSKSLEKRICALFEPRGIQFDLHGKRDSLKDESILYKGFIQSDEQFKKDNEICIRNIEGTEELGTGIIENSGKWKVILSKPAIDGQFLIRNKKTQQFLCGEKFYLIKDIKINTGIVRSVLTDLYGRKISISKREKTVPKDSVLWISDSAPDSRQSEIELSDKLTDLFLSFGKKIVINDPYFLGDIKENSTEPLTSTSQKIFMNALITALSKGKIEEIILLGYWKRAKNFVNNDKNAFIKKYKILTALINQTFKGHSTFNLKRFEMILCNEPFHDRYWMGDDVLFHVSNSINGAFESGEFKITKESDLTTIKIKPRLERRYSNGEKVELL